MPLIILRDKVSPTRVGLLGGLEPYLSMEWAFQVAQWLRISLPVQGMQVQTLNQEEPQEEMANYSSTSCLENPLDRAVWRAAVNGGRRESDATEHGMLY